MNLPPAIVLQTTLKAGAVYYFAYELFPEVPHYFVVLNKDVQNAENLIIIGGTSNVAGRINYNKQHKLDAATLIIVAPGEYEYLKKETAFDCNTCVFEYPLSMLADKINSNLFHAYSPISDDLLQRLREGVLKSRLISRRVKNKIE